MEGFTKAKRIFLKKNTNYDEKWIQKIIAEDPSILGLGDLSLRGIERHQLRAGRLDLLLEDQKTLKRFVMEIQLGATDPSHIIRSIEYWDLEQKRYPDYKHCAVLIAEDVTSRFLNVISLFNGAIPIIAMQMQAFEVGEHTTLVFTKIFDELKPSLLGEDEEVLSAQTDRAYWESKANSVKMLNLVERVFEWVRERDQELKLSYTKHYIGIVKDKRVNNFLLFRPTANFVRLELKIEQGDEVDQKLEESSLITFDYDRRYNRYRTRLTAQNITENEELIKWLISESLRNV